MPLGRPGLLLAAIASLLLLAAPGARAHGDQTEPHEHPITAQAQPGAPAAEDAAAKPIPRMPRPPDAVLYFISPIEGAVVESPVTVRFGLKGMGVAPAGVARPDTGHHHLIVDAPTPPLDQPVPNDKQHIHFGGGQTETTLALPLGSHELQLVFADQNHVPHDPPLVSDRITITVK